MVSKADLPPQYTVGDFLTSQTTHDRHRRNFGLVLLGAEFVRERLGASQLGGRIRFYRNQVCLSLSVHWGGLLN